MVLFYSRSLKFADDPSLSSITLKENQSIPLNVWNERHLEAGLSVIDDQDYKRRQEFSVKVRIARLVVLSMPSFLV